MSRPPPYAACCPMISEDINPLCGKRPNNGPFRPAKYRRDKGQTGTTQRPCSGWWLVQQFLEQCFRYCLTRLGFLLVREVGLFASLKSDVKTGYGKGAFAMSGLNSSVACKATRISQITDRNDRARGRAPVPGEIFCSVRHARRLHQ